MPGHYENNHFFIGDFDDQLENDLMIPLTTEIKHQSNQNNGSINLWINSVGGYAHLCRHFVSLVELAKRNGVIVRTMVPDMAYSAGSMLAITGTTGERYIDKDAEHLIHYGQIASFETTEEQIARFTAYKRRQFKKNINHYKKYCDVPDIEKHIEDDGYFVTSQQAIKWGMADKTLDKYNF